MLKVKASNLNAQVEAAKTYQKWAESTNDKKLYFKAIMGSDKGNDSKNIIWGWGKISKVTARFDRFRNVFHESRRGYIYCRFKFAGNKKPDLEKSKSALVATLKLYPDLGGADSWKQYNSLMIDIQKALNENPANGLPKPK